jgi:hypothetical protein
MLSVLFTEFFAARFLRSVVGPVLAPLKTLTVTVDSVTETVTSLPVIRDIVDLGDGTDEHPVPGRTPPRGAPPRGAPPRGDGSRDAPQDTSGGER